MHRFVAAKVREIARRRRMSLNRLADFASMSRSHLGRLLDCEQSPTLATLTRIAAALDVPTRELLPPTG